MVKRRTLLGPHKFKGKIQIFSRPNVPITVNSQFPHKDKNTLAFLSALPNPFQKRPAQLQHEVPLMGYSPSLTAPAWVLPVLCRSPRTAPTRIVPVVYSPSGIDCSSVSPQQASVTTRKPAPMWASLHRPQVLPESWASMGSPEVAASFRASLPLFSKGIHALTNFLIHHSPWGGIGFDMHAYVRAWKWKKIALLRE